MSSPINFVNPFGNLVDGFTQGRSLALDEERLALDEQKARQARIDNALDRELRTALQTGQQDFQREQDRIQTENARQLAQTQNQFTLQRDSQRDRSAIELATFRADRQDTRTDRTLTAQGEAAQRLEQSRRAAAELSARQANAAADRRFARDEALADRREAAALAAASTADQRAEVRADRQLERDTNLEQLRIAGRIATGANSVADAGAAFASGAPPSAAASNTSLRDAALDRLGFPSLGAGVPTTPQAAPVAQPGVQQPAAAPAPAVPAPAAPQGPAPTLQVPAPTGGGAPQSSGFSVNGNAVENAQFSRDRLVTLARSGQAFSIPPSSIALIDTIIREAEDGTTRLSTAAVNALKGRRAAILTGG